MVPTLYHLVRVLLKHSSELAQQKAGGDLKVGRGVVVKGGEGERVHSESPNPTAFGAMVLP